MRVHGWYHSLCKIDNRRCCLLHFFAVIRQCASPPAAGARIHTFGRASICSRGVSSRIRRRGVSCFWSSMSGPTFTSDGWGGCMLTSSPFAMPIRINPSHASFPVRVHAPTREIDPAISGFVCLRVADSLRHVHVAPRNLEKGTNTEYAEPAPVPTGRRSHAAIRNAIFTERAVARRKQHIPRHCLISHVCLSRKIRIIQRPPSKTVRTVSYRNTSFWENGMD